MYVHIYRCVHIYMCVYTYKYIFIYVCIYKISAAYTACVQLPPAPVVSCLYPSHITCVMHIHMYTYIHIYIYIYIYINMNIDTHILFIFICVYDRCRIYHLPLTAARACCIVLCPSSLTCVMYVP